jgi:hypothetical protein
VKRLAVFNGNRCCCKSLAKRGPRMDRVIGASEEPPYRRFCSAISSNLVPTVTQLAFAFI